MKPKISIVTPSYNQAEFIEETLVSVESQDYDNVEHFVKDGGSTDGTLDILESYDCDWESSSDDGQADAINTGFDRVDGDIIGWLNSDDVYFDKTVFNQVVDCFERTEADIIYGDYAIMDRNSKILTVRCLPDFDFGRLVRGCFIAQPSVFFRAEVLEDNRLDESLEYGMDYEFWLRLASEGYEFKHVRSVLSGDRNHKDRKIRKEADEMVSESKELKREYGISTGIKYGYERLTDKLFSGMPRRLCGVRKSLKIHGHELAFDGDFVNKRELVRNQFKNNQDLVFN